MREHGNDSIMKFFSISTASANIAWVSFWLNLSSNLLYNRHAKSVCSPSSRDMNSLLRVRPGNRFWLLNQKIQQKAPLKKTPSTIANAIRRVAKLA